MSADTSSRTHTYSALGIQSAEARTTFDAVPVVDSALDVSARGMHVVLTCTEFTCRCPVTGQPDFAEIVLDYVPHEHFVESKSVKLYLESWREQRVFHEHLAQAILRDFVRDIAPIAVDVCVRFNVRGGIAIEATASYLKAGDA